jgi:hypothetical protein
VTIPGLTGAAAAKVLPAPVTQQYRQSHLKLAEELSAGRRPSLSGGPATARDMQSGTESEYTWGVFVDSTLVGGQATQVVNPNIVMQSSDPDIIFAPTFIPSGISCIEISTIYANNGDLVGAFDWCANGGNGEWGKQTPVGDLSSYITEVNGQQVYSVQDVQTDASTNSWTAYLYNYQTDTWDPFYTSASTAKLSQTGGRWDMWEVHSFLNPLTGQGYYCTDTYGANWATTDLQYEISPGTWQTASPSNSSFSPTDPSAQADACDSLSFSVLNPNNSWQVPN